MLECLLLNLKNQTKTQHNESTHKNQKSFYGCYHFNYFFSHYLSTGLTEPGLALLVK